MNDVEELLKLQPEVFYETLLTFSSNNEKTLSLWTALHPHVLARFRQYPTGNIVHKALVKYSAQFGIPSLTTNFDTLFESAAGQGGMKSPVVYLPTQPTPDTFPSNTAKICKLHGSIEANGNPDVSSLYTTMTQIAKVNVRWIKYLTTLMKEFHICFVGYSGRDLDLFPLIEGPSHESETKTPIWINKQFSGDPSDGPSKLCKALRLEGLFPSELLARILPHDAQSAPSLVDSNPVLSSLASELRTSLDLSADSQQLLHAQLLQKLGQYTQALTLVTSIGISHVHQHYGTYLLLSSRLRHEISEYERSKALAKSAFTWACRRRPPGYRNVMIQSLCCAADPHRMIVPFDTYFEDQFVTRAVLTLEALGVFTIFLVMLKVVAWSAKNGTLSVETCHEMLEHRVRLLSIIQGILMTLRKIRNNLPIGWLEG